MDQQSVHKTLQDISENTAGLIWTEEKISEQLRLSEMVKAYKDLFSKVGIPGKGVGSLQHIGEVQVKCNGCNLVMHQRKYKDYNAGDKTNLRRYKLFAV